MATNKVAIVNRATMAITITLSTLMLAGCLDDRYLARRDSVTLGVGNSVASNQATHTIHPWPKNVKNTKIPGNGKRILTAIERYQQNKSLQPKGLNTTTISIQGGPGQQANAGIEK